jgi:hypothetical protein
LAEDAGTPGSEPAQQIDAADRVRRDADSQTIAAGYEDRPADNAAGSAPNLGGGSTESAQLSSAAGTAGREITSDTSAASHSNRSAGAVGGPASGPAEQVSELGEAERDTKSRTSTTRDAERSEGDAGGSADKADALADRAGRSADKADGSASEAAQEVDAVDEVERNTKSQTTAASYTTTNHDVIRAWAEARGGQPAEVGDTDTGNGGVLRIEFRDEDNRLDEVDWDAFFDVFDDRNLAFRYQEKTSDGEVSRFNKFVNREA